MSVTKAPNGRWQARWRDAGGKQRAKNFDRKIDAERHERTMREGAARGEEILSPAAARVTVRTWAEEWLRNARNLGQGGSETYRRDLDLYVLPALGDLPLRRLTADAIDAYLDDELVAGVATSSVHRHYRTLHRLCEVAVHRGRLTTNPCAKVTPPRVVSTDMRILTAAEVETLASTISARYRALVLVFCYAGLRWSEAVGLRRARVAGDRLVVVEQLVQRADGQWHRDPPKSKAGTRSIALPRFLVAELGEHLDRWSQPDADGLVFPNGDGGPLRSSNFTGMVFKPACVRAGIGHLATVDDRRRYVDTPRIHDLRHTSAALAIAAGAHPKALQVRMGHASIKTTLDTYGHLFPEMDEQIALDLDRIRSRVR